MRLRGPVVAAVLLLAGGRAHARSAAEVRDAIVEGTLVHLGTPYLWGGEHPDTGLDCSAFVRMVYDGARLSLPRNSRAQYAATRRLGPAEVLPGDLVFFGFKHPGKVDHVGIYVGRGYFVHASYSRGVRIDPITLPYYWDSLVAVRRHPAF